MSDTARPPQVGDVIRLRGLERVIVRIDQPRNKVWFSNPPSHPVPIHPSREGACAMSELELVENGAGTMWTLAGAGEVRVPRADAIQLGAAVFEINAANRAGRV